MCVTTYQFKNQEDTMWIKSRRIRVIHNVPTIVKNNKGLYTFPQP